MSLFPDISGNKISGFGENTIRKPTPLYWFDPDTIPHGELQKYFYETATRFAGQRKETSRMAHKRGPEKLDNPNAMLKRRHRKNPAG